MANKTEQYKSIGQQINKAVEPMREAAQRINLSLMYWNIDFFDRFMKPLGFGRRQPEPPRLDVELTKYIANSFLKRHRWKPYTMPTREDFQQEAYLAYLEARKDYDPSKGDLRSYYFKAIYNYFFNKYEEAAAFKKRSENDNYRLEYLPEFTERFTEPETDLYYSEEKRQERAEELEAKRQGLEVVTYQRFQESFQRYDEEEYTEPERIEKRESEAGFYSLGGQLFKEIQAAKRPEASYTVIEKKGCQLGYRKRQEVFSFLSWPFNEHEEIRRILYDRRKKIFYRTPFFKFLLSGSALRGYTKEGKEKLRVSRNVEEGSPLWPGGYSYRTIKRKENNALRGVAYDKKRNEYLKAFLPDRSRDKKRQFPINDYSVIELPLKSIVKTGRNRCASVKSNCIEVIYESISNLKTGNKFKIKSVEVMKRARRKYADLKYKGRLIRDLSEFAPFITEKGFNSNYDKLYREAWRIIETFPAQQRRIFELYYNNNELIITAKNKQKILFDSFSVNVHDDRKITDSEYTLNENVQLKYTLRSIAKILKFRYANILNLHNQGVKKLSRQFAGTFKKKIP